MLSYSLRTIYSSVIESVRQEKVSVTIQIMKAIEQLCELCHLFIMLYKVALTLECVDDILKCDHSDESK